MDSNQVCGTALESLDQKGVLKRHILATSNHQVFLRVNRGMGEANNAALSRDNMDMVMY